MCAKRGPAAERFWRHVDQSGDCWLWTGATQPRGYGVFGAEGRKVVRAYRFAYELLVGPIPEGLELDHLCRIPRCVNPAHLEPVTHAENNRRAARAVTHCPHGHEYTTENTYVCRRGMRTCRICKRLNDRRYYSRKRVA